MASTPTNTTAADCGHAPHHTSLDPLETPEQDLEEVGHGAYNPHPDFACEPCSPLETSFRHSGWATDRRRVWNAMLSAGIRPNVLDRFATCGSAAWVMRHKTDARLRISCNTCRNRWCVPCARARAMKLAEQTRRWAIGKDLRFITLTLRHNSTPLDEQIARIYAAFKELRRRPCWKDTQEGGVAFLEVKLSKSNRWHPHLHIISTGSYLAQDTLSATWLAITGDSSIVHIAKVEDRKRIVTYCTAYCTKPTDNNVYRNRERLAEAMLAMRGTKLANTFGTARCIKLSATTDDLEPEQWEPVGRLDDIHRRAQEGDTWAQALIAQLSQKRSASPSPCSAVNSP